MTSLIAKCGVSSSLFEFMVGFVCDENLMSIWIPIVDNIGGVSTMVSIVLT